MRIAILGGTGFVGQALLNQLALSAHHVRVLSRYPSRHRGLSVIPNVELAKSRANHVDELAYQLRDRDVVINLVGILNERGRDGKGFTQAHVTLTENMISACKQVGVTRCIHISALNADPHGPSHYLRSKGEAELRLRKAGDADFSVSLLQPSVIFGPGDSFISRFARLLKHIPLAMPLPRPNARFAPVYVGDVVKAILVCLNQENTGGKTYQLCGPTVYSLRELIEYILQQQQLKRKIIPLNNAFARVQATVMEFVPGKPFSLDNFHSLSVNSLCEKDGFKKLNISRTPLDAIVPHYL